MQRLLIVSGVALLVAGIAWPLLSRIGLGRLPGDIAIGRGNTSFYFPIVTCIIVSIVLSALMWLFNR
jgi:uncharacterized protein HemY